MLSAECRSNFQVRNYFSIQHSAFRIPACPLLPSQDAWRDDADAGDTGTVRGIDHFDDLAVAQASVAANPQRAIAARGKNIAQARLDGREFHRLRVDRDPAV